MVEVLICFNLKSALGAQVIFLVWVGNLCALYIAQGFSATYTVHFASVYFVVYVFSAYPLEQKVPTYDIVCLYIKPSDLIFRAF